MDLKELTLDEEFRMFTAVLMNNWSALKLLISHSEDSVSVRNSKIEELFEYMMSSVRDIVYSNGEFITCVENVEDFIDVKFNTYIEDNSCEEVMSELLKYYNLLLYNQRDELSNAMHHFKEKRSIFSNEIYNPDLVVRIISQSNIPRPNEKQNAPMEDSSEMSNSSKTTEPDSEWETVTHKRNKNR